VAEKTGISRGTLSKIANEKGYNTVTANIDKLCAYFGCQASDLMTFIEDKE
jgi:DNA-binding Xre family transcriptional regulator